MYICAYTDVCIYIHTYVYKEMDAQERIQYIIEQEGITQADFARQTEINTSTLSHVLTGRNKASLNVLRKVVQAYPRYNAAWVMSGKGDPLSTSEDSEPCLFPHSMQPHPPISEAPSHLSQSSITASPVPVPKRQVTKVIIYYDDSTFETFLPGQE